MSTATGHNHLADTVECVAINAMVTESARWQARYRGLLYRTLERSGVAGCITPFLAAYVSGGELVIRGRESLWSHLAFRSDPLGGRFPTSDNGGDTA